LVCKDTKIKDAILSQQQFQKLIDLQNFPGFGQKLYQEFTDNETKPLTLNNFLDGVSQCIRSRPRQALRVMFRICSGGKEIMPEAEVMGILALVYALCCGMNGNDATVSFSNLQGLAYMLTKKAKPAEDGSSKYLNCNDFMGWAEKYVPLFHTPLGAYLEKVLLTPLSTTDPVPTVVQTRQPVFVPPRLCHSSPILGQNLMPHVALLATRTAKMHGPWVKLYNSQEDGISFNRVCHKILGYGGPTILLIRDTGGAVFGGLAPSQWRANNEMYGEGEGFVFRLAPDFRIYPARVGGNGSFMYLNLKGFSLPHGMGLGGTIGNFRIFLPESLEECTSTTRCLTFENGVLSSAGKGTFEIQDLEIWGCGGSEDQVQKAMGKQVLVRQATADNILKARKVDKAAFLDNAFDKEFLLGKTFSTGARAVADDVREEDNK